MQVGRGREGNDKEGEVRIVESLLSMHYLYMPTIKLKPME